MNTHNLAHNCGECGRMTGVNGSKLACSLCLELYHVQCTNLSRFDHKSMTKYDKQNWMCHNCIYVFPFNTVLEQDLFVKLTQNQWKSNVTIKCQDLLFDPFERLKSHDIKLPCDHYHPDIQHFTDSHNIDEVCNSNYYDSEEFNNMLPNNAKLSFYHCNLRSAKHNSIDLSNYMRSLKNTFDIIGLSETWLNSTTTDIVGFPNYVQVHKYREQKTGGGISLLINDKIRFHELESLSMCTEVIETVFVEAVSKLL